MNLIDDYLESLSESYKSSTIKRSRPQKLKSTAGSMAITLARRANDPLYKRMIKFKKMYKDIKEQIERKYKSKANTMARILASR